MKYQTEFRDRSAVRHLVERIRHTADGMDEVKLMEVCGSHTMAICRFGIRQLLPPNLTLLSGPGCPVCVTEGAYLDTAIAMARLPDVVIATFGDLMRVPGSSSSLEREKAAGATVDVVFSPLQAVDGAQKSPGKRVVFLGIGFETTIPGVALAIKEAATRGLTNFFVLCGHKVIPTPLAALATGATRINGFILPGHVSTIIGTRPYEFLASEHGIACAVAGFEPADILQATLMLLQQLRSGTPRVQNEYTRVVRPEGNPGALAAIDEVFEQTDVVWRGIGVIPDSGLMIRESFAAFDAKRRIACDVEPTIEKAGCICGEILQGLKTPRDCPLFGKACTPVNPIGACMVSSEGSCAANYKYMEAPGE